MSRPYRDHTADHIGDFQMSDHIKRGKQVELLDALQVERARYVEQRSASRALAGNRLSDGAGLFLFVTPNNAKSWRFEYRYPKGGKRHILGLRPRSAGRE